MSVASQPKPQKATCSKCQRTVFIAVIDGERIALDSEVILVVLFSDGTAKVAARRVHGELCPQYTREHELRVAKAKAKKKS